MATDTPKDILALATQYGSIIDSLRAAIAAAAIAAERERYGTLERDARRLAEMVVDWSTLGSKDFVDKYGERSGPRAVAAAKSLLSLLSLPESAKPDAPAPVATAAPKDESPAYRAWRDRNSFDTCTWIQHGQEIFGRFMDRAGDRWAKFNSIKTAEHLANHVGLVELTGDELAAVVRDFEGGTKPVQRMTNDYIPRHQRTPRPEVRQ